MNTVHEEADADVQDATRDDIRKEAQRGFESAEALDVLEEQTAEVLLTVQNGPGEEDGEADRGKGRVAPERIRDESRFA